MFKKSVILFNWKVISACEALPIIPALNIANNRGNIFIHSPVKETTHVYGVRYRGNKMIFRSSLIFFEKV